MVAAPEYYSIFDGICRGCGPSHPTRSGILRSDCSSMGYPWGSFRRLIYKIRSSPGILIRRPGGLTPSVRQRGGRFQLPMRIQLFSITIGVLFTSCIPDWEPIEIADRIYHRNDTQSLYYSMSVNHSNQQFIDTLDVGGWFFDLSLSAYPDHGQGTLYVFDERDSLLLMWSFQNSDTREKTFNRRPFRTILSLREYSGNLWLSLRGRKY